MFNFFNKGKRLPGLLLFSLATLSLFSCGKDIDVPGASSLAVINCVVGSRPLVTNFNGSGKHIAYLQANRMAYHSYQTNNNLFGSYTGMQKLALFQYPDTLEKDQPLLDLRLHLPPGSINTLFLTGTVDEPDTLFRTEEIPYIPSGDSIMRIRFVNLSPGSEPFSVNLAGNPPGSLAAGISYRSMNGYTSLPVSVNLPEYIFELRDAATGVLIATYTTKGINNDGEYKPNAGNYANTWVYRHFTLALTGLPKGTGDAAPSVLLIPHQPLI
ncbi:DUF4397 domain-containing protein [Pseudoflavitalea rhizosphaerae]|uniref:DUF4397 domain-containing protein n=1 Tax=Pseudoflavitalea rhizosphaerae TaxID=1884793 RepID=UPI000F8EA65F|nr:DUF4397 domain-containing protein [Pseudoflavitalea rhizosphaerae]